MTDVLTISAAEIPAIAEAGGLILDVRTRAEHVQQRLTTAHELEPLDKLDPKAFMKKHGLDAEAPVFLLCRSDSRARVAAQKFAEAGYPNAIVIEGGILAAAEAGIAMTGVMARKPVPKPKAPGL